jgi:hypothetical protein
MRERKSAACRKQKKKLCWMMDEDEDVGRGISKGMLCDAAMQVD